MRSLFLPVLLTFVLVACGGSGSIGNNTTPPPLSVSGKWNVVLTQSSGQPFYTFGLALTQSGAVVVGNFVPSTVGNSGGGCFEPSSATTNGSVAGQVLTLHVQSTSSGLHTFPSAIDITGTVSSGYSKITGNYTGQDCQSTGSAVLSRQ